MRIGHVALLVSFALLASCASAPAQQAGGQDPPAWRTDYAEAIDEALRGGRLVLLFGGRETCGNCTYMMNTTLETSRIKTILEERYVRLYVPVDTSRDWYRYSPEGSWILPLLVVIDPADPNRFLERWTSIQEADPLAARLEELAGSTPAR